MRSLLIGLCAVALAVSSVWARPLHDGWVVSLPSCSAEAARAVPAPSLAVPPALFDQDNRQPLHAAAIEHSDAYQMRARIHKYASFATLPLFAAEVALGQSLYDGTESGGKKTAHAVVGAGIVGLFGLNTVTGAWNMFGEEGRRETEGRTRRWVHGLLMMAADVGFLATEASAPSSGGRNGALSFTTDRVTHRNIAIASISTATAGYLIMLFGNH